MNSLITTKQKEKLKTIWTKDTKLSKNILQFIALITMTIDHITASGVLYKPFGIKGYNLTSLSMNPTTPLLIGSIMRIIGRIAFPIYVFFLIYGMLMTSNYKKHLTSLFTFALISEIPFDLALKQQLTLSQQNVYFELFLIGLMIATLQKIKNNNQLTDTDQLLLKLATLITIGTISFVIKADYSVFGILAAFIIYNQIYSKNHTCLAMLFGFLFQAEIYLATYLPIPLIYMYNGKMSNKNNPKRNKIIKNIYYWYYPVHLTIIALILYIQ